MCIYLWTFSERGVITPLYKLAIYALTRKAILFTKHTNTMELQHINNKAELPDILQGLPMGAKHLIIDAIGRPVGDYYPETLTDYVHRIQDELYERRRQRRA